MSSFVRLFLLMLLIVQPGKLWAEPQDFPTHALASQLGTSQEEYGKRFIEVMADDYFSIAARASFTSAQLAPFLNGEGEVALGLAGEALLQSRLKSASVGEVLAFLPQSIRSPLQRLGPDTLSQPSELLLKEGVPEAALEYARMKVYQRNPLFREEAREALTRLLKEKGRVPFDVILPPPVIPAVGESPARAAPLAIATDGHHRVKAALFCIDHLGVKEADIPYTLNVVADFRKHSWEEYALTMDAHGKGNFSQATLKARASALAKVSAEEAGAERQRLVARDHARYLNRGFRDESFRDSPLRSAVGQMFWTRGVVPEFFNDYVEFHLGEVLADKGLTIEPGTELLPETLQHVAEVFFESEKDASDPLHFLLTKVKAFDRMLPFDKRSEVTAERKAAAAAMLEKAVTAHVQKVLDSFELPLPAAEFLADPDAFVSRALERLQGARQLEFLRRLKRLRNCAKRSSGYVLNAFVWNCAKGGLRQSPR